jgi:hypothetical protein
MAAEGYFASVLIILTALIFIALVLGFLYMIYGKEETEEEEEE